jgi:hypothetical protein
MQCAGFKEILDKAENRKKYNLHVVFDDSKTIEYLDLDNNVVALEKSHKYVKDKSKSKSKSSNKSKKMVKKVKK